MVPPISSAPLASVIVPVRNGEAHLPSLIRALAAQTIPRDSFEVVIGDDGSTDGSARAAATEDGWVRAMLGPPQNAYAARNRAARSARAPVLAFCDADCLPEPGWLAAGLRALEQAELVAGEIRFLVRERHTVWALLDIDTFKDHERQVRAANAETANLFVRRELFERLGGFDELEPGHGDFDFVERCVGAGARLVYAPEAVVTHPTHDAARPFLRTVWSMHRSYAARARRAGLRPDALRLRSWVPLVQPLRSRRRFGRSLALDRRRLAANGVRPRLLEDLRALVIMYLLLPYFEGAAQLAGWRDGRRAR